MLSFIFRGFFLIGVLSWYSASVWKMIDGYFKNQFQNYLDEQYKRNPRMRSDVDSQVSVGKEDHSAAGVLEATEAHARRIVEVCDAESCPIGTAETAEEAQENGSKWTKEAVTGGSSENEATSGSTDKNAFLETVVESGLESRKPQITGTHDEGSHRESPVDRNDRVANDESKRIISVDADQERSDDMTSETTRYQERSARYDSRRKFKVRTISSINRDMSATFKARKAHDDSDPDFWEFDEDGEERQPREGIPVTELPFKPRVDIGNLERVTADEYCPLTLEDELSCGETTKWP